MRASIGVTTWSVGAYILNYCCVKIPGTHREFTFSINLSLCFSTTDNTCQLKHTEELVAPWQVSYLPKNIILWIVFKGLSLNV